ncbi:MAG: UDP-N-acetyl-D-mannosamine dehydrogenase [Anaerolineales bacterium]|nr:UDP-N-acetyl-D-mannosamine dehydrogenase [Anaerolineales bacterium]
MKFDKICILGLGYIGLPTASAFASHAVKVVGVDVNPRVVETLQAGKIHIHEPGLGEAVRQAIAGGNLSVATRPEPADAFIIAVPTPFYDDKRADMRAVTAAAEAIAPHLRPGNLVVLESTSPPRTTVDLIAPILEKSGLKAGADFYLAYSPERVLPGQILRELIENARVIGGITPASAQAGRELYSIFVTGEIIQTDATTAEMVKLMENTYRDVNIAIANEFARLADRFGVDIWEAIGLANRHPRVKILNPGPGVGGHCISVDPWFLVEAAPDLAQLIRAARQVNDSQPRFVLELVREALGSLPGKRIAALGLAFKPDVDDLRESPAAEIVHLLQKEGAAVTAFEPFRPEGLPGIEAAASLAESLEEADLVLLLVGHSQFRNLTPADLAALTACRLLVDTVGAWSGTAWSEAGFQLHKLGVRK